MQQVSIIDVLKSELKKRNNPNDLKSANIAKVVALEPLTLSVFGGKVLLIEGEDFYISEWFIYRCNIDKDFTLSSTVPTLLANAKSVQEVHSSGQPCTIPEAINFLANAIENVKNELYALKCILKIGDNVVICALEQTDKYILIDKVNNHVS